MPYARISITLPRDVLTAADRRARQLERSRSWLIADALRQYLQVSAGGAVREPLPLPYAAGSPGLGAYRLEQLKADFALTPEQRVIAAEQTARVAEHTRRRPAAQRVLQFDRYEDYLDWKRREDIL